MATKKKSKKVSKASKKAAADKVLGQTLYRLSKQHANMLPLEGTDADNVVSRSKPYPVYKGAGKKTDWFRQVAVTSEHAHTAAVEPVKRPRDAARLLRLANEAFNKDRKAKNLARQYAAVASVPTPGAPKGWDKVETQPGD